MVATANRSARSPNCSTKKRRPKRSSRRWTRRNGARPANEDRNRPPSELEQRSGRLLKFQVEPAPDFDQRRGQLAHHRFVVRRSRREAQAFGAARDGREIDRLHIDAILDRKSVV